MSYQHTLKPPLADTVPRLASQAFAWALKVCMRVSPLVVSVCSNGVSAASDHIDSRAPSALVSSSLARASVFASAIERAQRQRLVLPTHMSARIGAAMALRATSRRVRAAAVVALAGAALSGCYVVPLHHAPDGTPYPYVSAAPGNYGTVNVIPAPYAAPAPTTTVILPVAPAGPLTFTARLYPVNDLASGFGVVGAIVTNDLNGRGSFSTNIGGESFSGEATRTGGLERGGIANGSGNRGNYVNCTYKMNSTTQGSGVCRHSSGATFSMHVGG